MNRSLILSSSFTVKEFTKLIEIISQYNLIYKESDIRLTISNEFIDDTTLYLSMFKIQENIKELIGTTDDPFYFIKINLYKSVTSNTMEKILELTQLDDRVKIIFNIKVNSDLKVLSCFETLNKYSRLLPENSFFYRLDFYLNNQSNEFISEFIDNIYKYGKDEVSIIPSFSEDVISDDYVNKTLNLINKLYINSTIASPDFIIDTHFNQAYGCRLNCGEIPIIFKNNQILSTYCSNSCCMSSNIDYIDPDRNQCLITKVDDIRNIYYTVLEKDSRLPGFISCPLQKTSKDYMLINAYLAKVKEMLYSRYKV